MSAAYLREAAAEIRDEWSDNRAMGQDRNEWQTWRAVADWLDLAASDVWAWGPPCPCGTGCDACDDNEWEPHYRRALAVARAYLGAAS